MFEVRISYFKHFRRTEKERRNAVNVEIVTVSSKGQIVLPKEMRDALSISVGSALAAFATDEVIVLKPVKLPTEEEFSKWLDEAQGWARDAGFKKQDMNNVVRAVRGRKGK